MQEDGKKDLVMETAGLVKVLLILAGQVTFLALEFMFIFVCAFFTIIAGFVSANHKGGRK